MITRRSELLDHRQALREEYQRNSEEFDKTIITLSSALLGLSVAFIKDIAPEPAKWTLPFLFFAWFFLGLSLITIVFSFLLAIRAREYAIKDIDFELTTGKGNPSYKPSKAANYLSWASATSLILGIMLYLIFAAINIFFI